MNIQAEQVIEELLSQITALSRERAFYAALVKQYQQELERVKQELEQLKQGKENEE
ncbi:hypothetical protein QT236_14295 [Geobacillus stearothermophilus]|nr:hypothetical protein QT236_12490 [Geobacillus stearothermophilus]WJQ03191.1 hypothetical protein QT236_14295 [Geobacillus stearothermophilus]